LTDIRVWLGAFVFFSQVTVIYSISFFLPAIIRQFGFSDVISNVLTAPVHAVCAMATICNGIHSDRTRDRYLHILIPNFFGIIFWGFVAYSLETMELPLQYVMILLGSCASTMGGPITLIWPMDILRGSTAAAIAPGMIVGIGNIGGIIGPQIFSISQNETGTYSWAALAMGVSSFLSICLTTALWIVLKRNEMNEEEYLLRPEKERT
jgi:ACS family tartrate transporter-like MFS transporter